MKQNMGTAGRIIRTIDFQNQRLPKPSIIKTIISYRLRRGTLILRARSVAL